MDYDSDHEEPFHGFIPESSNIEIENLPPPINTRLCQPTSPSGYFSSSGSSGYSGSSDSLGCSGSYGSSGYSGSKPRRMSDDINSAWKLESILYDKLFQSSDVGEAPEHSFLDDEVFHQEEIGREMLLNPMFLPTASVLQRRGNYIQDDLRRNALCQLKVHDLPINQDLLLGIIHDNAELVSKPIKNDDNPNLTPFQAWPAGGFRDDTIYRGIQIEKIGMVYGSIITMRQENIVNFKFPLLSSDCRNYGDTKHGRAWKLLLLPLPRYSSNLTGIYHISANDMRYHQFRNIQVVAELRPLTDTKKPKRTMPYSYPHNFEMPCGSPIQSSLPIPRLQAFNYIGNSNDSIAIEEDNDTRDLDDLYKKLCKAIHPDTLKDMFSATLVMHQNATQLVSEIIPEDLEKILTDSLALPEF